MARLINSFRSEEGGVVMDYIDTSKDLWGNGLMMNHTIFIPLASDYDEEIDAVRDALMALLNDALEDTGLQLPLDLSASAEPEDLDDENEDVADQEGTEDDRGN